MRKEATKQFQWIRNDAVLLLIGKLNKDLLNPLWNARYEVMQKIYQINLDSITDIDTAGVALLLHLVAISKKQGRGVSIVGVGEKVYALFQFYNLPIDMLSY